METFGGVWMVLENVDTFLTLELPSFASSKVPALRCWQHSWKQPLPILHSPPRALCRSRPQDHQSNLCRSPFKFYFPTCQVRVVRFYVSCLPPSAFRLPPAACHLPPAASCLVLLVLVQLRSAIHIVLCRTSTTTIHGPRPVFPAGPQPRPAMPSVPCRTSTATIPAQCSLPDLNRDHPRPVFPAGPYEICQIECQKICQMEFQIE